MTADGGRQGAALVLCHDAFGGRGGIAKYNRDLIEAVATMDAFDHVLCLTRNPPPDPVELPILATGLRQRATRGRLGFAAAALSAALRLRPRLVVSGHINLLPVAWAAARLARARLIMPAHGIDAWEPTGRRLADGLVRSLDLALPVSRLTARRLRAWTGLPEDKVCVLGNCVDRHVFRPGPRPIDLEARYGFGGCRVVASLGRMDDTNRKKGYDDLLELWPALSARRPDLRLMLAGDGGDRPRLQAKARDLGVAGTVAFPGYVRDEEKLAHLRLADVFVLCGRQEGFGIVLLEAMACGVPVVGSTRDGTGEVVRDVGVGQLADPDRPETIAEAIERALDDDRRVAPEGLGRFDVAAFRAGLHRALRPLLTAR